MSFSRMLLVHNVIGWTGPGKVMNPRTTLDSFTFFHARQSIIFILATFVHHHHTSLSPQAENLPPSQILPTADHYRCQADSRPAASPATYRPTATNEFN